MCRAAPGEITHRKPFPKSARLLKKVEFDRVFSKPTHTIKSYPFLLLSAENCLGYARLGLVVGKRRVPHSVDRNFLRRLCRECFRHTWDQLPGADVVLLFQGANHGFSKRKLNNKISKSLSRLARYSTSKQGAEANINGAH